MRKDGDMQIDRSTRETLHRVAVHIVARARVQATGRFSLRVTPGGFGTPEFGTDSRRVRVSGTTLVIESDAQGAPRAQAIEIDGATLGTLAAFAGVDLDDPIDVGSDTTPLGDVDAPLTLDHDTARALAGWYARVNVALDVIITRLAAGGVATPVRLWPEHFDVAIDVLARPGQRVNLGGSPGDSFSSEPYLYVGPFTAERPGDDDYWNTPFGAALAASDVQGDDPVAGAVEFLLEGVQRFTRPG
jgi:hypothetical protein